jgi:hypothetical protein
MITDRKQYRELYSLQLWDYSLQPFPLPTSTFLNCIETFDNFGRNLRLTPGYAMLVTK